MLNAVLLTLIPFLSFIAAQSFPEGYSYDWNIPSLSSGCQTALNQSVQCHWLLPTYDMDSIDLSTENLTSICTAKCIEDLKSTRNAIDEACPTSSNIIVADDIAYPATQSIDRLIYTYVKLCLKDTASNGFCYNTMRSWQSENELTDSQLCSDCLLGTMQLDQSSGFAYNEDFAANYSSLTASCHKTGFAPSKPTPIALNSTTTATATPSVCASTYTIQAGDTCNGICTSHNVSTFEMLQYNQLDAYCRNFPSTGAELCMPPSCDVYTVQANDTCRSIAAAQAPTYVTITQLQAWNPNLNQLCTNMEQQVDMQICVSPPNGTLSGPTNSAPVETAPTTPAPVPTDAANGTSTRCGKWYFVNKGDTCGDITIRAYPGISLSDFYFLNPSIDQNCTNLLAGESYCILPVGDIHTYPGYGSGTGTATCTGEGSPSSCYSAFSLLSPTSFAGATTPPTGSINATATGTGTTVSSSLATYTPPPMASGSYDSPKCGRFATYVDTGDDDTNEYANSCQYVARFNNITIDDLEKFNPTLAQADPCILDQTHRYCVGLNATSTTPSMSSSGTGGDSQTPSPTQDGMVDNCKSFYLVKDGDGCYDIASENNISLNDFYSYNPAVGNDCSGLYPKYYVCVGIGLSSSSSSSVSAPPSTTSSVGNGISTPTPLQDGMVNNCNKFYKVKSGDGCYAIAQDNGCALDSFYAWNPAIGNDCSKLYPDYYVCVGTASGSDTTTAHPTTTQGGIATPSPSSPGMTSGCTDFYKAVSGDYCSKITDKFDISISDFEGWNPDVGSDCGLIRLDYYYCVAH